MARRKRGIGERPLTRSEVGRLAARARWGGETAAPALLAPVEVSPAEATLVRMRAALLASDWGDPTRCHCYHGRLDSNRFCSQCGCTTLDPDPFSVMSGTLDDPTNVRGRLARPPCAWHTVGPYKFPIVPDAADEAERLAWLESNGRAVAAENRQTHTRHRSQKRNC